MTLTVVNGQPPVRVVVERREVVLALPWGRPGPPGVAPLTMSIRGPLAAAPGVIPFPVPYDMTVIEVQAAVAFAPSGAADVLDVLVDGASLFGAGPKPTIAPGVTLSVPVVPAVALLPAGSIVTVDVVQVGSIQPGADCTIVLQVVANPT